jgi:hypothetical protein
VRCQNRVKLDYHVQALHTSAGLRSRLHSETKLAAIFREAGIEYDQDFDNVVNHSKCTGLSRYFRGTHSRPDFYMTLLSMEARAVVLVGNDEFGHRRYPCEFDRILKISSALSANPSFFGLPIVYIRFNPHFYQRGDTLFDPDLATRHARLLEMLSAIKKRELPLVNPTGLNLVYMYYDTVQAPMALPPNKVHKSQAVQADHTIITNGTDSHAKLTKHDYDSSLGRLGSLCSLRVGSLASSLVIFAECDKTNADFAASLASCVCAVVN